MVRPHTGPLPAIEEVVVVAPILSQSDSKGGFFDYYSDDEVQLYYFYYSTAPNAANALAAIKGTTNKLGGKDVKIGGSVFGLRNHKA